MTPKRSTEPELLYILHFEHASGAIAHYTGRTTARRINDRLTEHDKGRGADKTRDLVRAGYIRTSAWTYPLNDRRLEQVTKLPWITATRCKACHEAALRALHLTSTAENLEKTAPNPLEGSTDRATKADH